MNSIDSYALNTGTLSGKTAVITGANTGLGFELAVLLAQRDVEVVLACRNIKKANTARDYICKVTNNPKVHVVHIDLIDLDSVYSGANAIKGLLAQINLCINNAGIAMPEFSVSRQGVESQMATNHIGHFALTLHLLPRLLNTHNSRVVNVTSLAYLIGKTIPTDLTKINKRSYSPFACYAQSKLANLLFTHELNKKVMESGLSLRSTSAHPGGASTGLMDDVLTGYLGRKLKPYVMPQSAVNGAAVILQAALDKDLSKGNHFVPSGVLQLKGSPTTKQKKLSKNHQHEAKRLWNISERITGLSYST